MATVWTKEGIGYRDLGDGGLEIALGKEPKCKRCHRVISVIVLPEGSWRVRCKRTLQGVKSGKERTPSYCPMRSVTE